MDDYQLQWQQLSDANQYYSNAKKYDVAVAIRAIMKMTGAGPTTIAAECKRRHLRRLTSQGEISRRLRCANLLDQLWANGTLPKDVFIRESGLRYVVLTKNVPDDLKLMTELFSGYTSDDEKRELAEQLSPALIRKHLETREYVAQSLSAKKCACGCGKTPTPGRRFIAGHNMKNTDYPHNPTNPMSGLVTRVAELERRIKDLELVLASMGAEVAKRLAVRGEI